MTVQLFTVFHALMVSVVAFSFVLEQVVRARLLSSITIGLWLVFNTKKNIAGIAFDCRICNS